jgi:hypothetical protein
VAGRIDFPAAPGRIGPDFWPKSILVLLGLVCVYEIIKNLLVGETFTAAGLLEKLMKDSGRSRGRGKAAQLSAAARRRHRPDGHLRTSPFPRSASSSPPSPTSRCSCSSGATATGP